VCQFNGGQSENWYCCMFLSVRIYRAAVTAHHHHILSVELWFRNPHTTSGFSGGPQLRILIPFLCCLPISDVPDSRVTKEFGIFTESLIMNNLQSIAQENCSQLVNSLETVSVQYIANLPGRDKLFTRYRVDVSPPEILRAYSSLTPRNQPSISSLRI
jgi:hypothetical protein